MKMPSNIKFPRLRRNYSNRKISKTKRKEQCHSKNEQFFKKPCMEYRNMLVIKNENALKHKISKVMEKL